MLLIMDNSLRRGLPTSVYLSLTPNTTYFTVLSRSRCLDVTGRNLQMDSAGGVSVSCCEAQGVESVARHCYGHDVRLD